MSDFLTTRQLQEILHVDRTTIYRMADGGRVPAVKVGSQWRFPRRAVESWLKLQSDAGVAADAALTPAPAGAANGAALSATGNALGMDKLLPVECVLKIQDAFADLLGVTLIAADLRGEPLLPPSNLCGLLRLAWQQPAGRQACMADWAELAAGPGVAAEVRAGRLGLLHTHGLVRVGSEIKALVVAAGIAPEPWPPDADEVARLAALLEVSEATLRDELGGVQRLDAADQQRLPAVVQRVADIIAHILSERNLLFTRLQHIADLSQI